METPKKSTPQNKQEVEEALSVDPAAPPAPVDVHAFARRDGEIIARAAREKAARAVDHAQEKRSPPANVMAITKRLISVPPVNRVTVAARALSQCGLMEALRRLRNGGTQVVRVEHVHVNAGGQAIHRKRAERDRRRRAPL